MATIKVGQENSAPIELHYEDLGAGRPVVLIHGYPLSGASWEKQVTGLLANGRRVIAYDRRGFGGSTHTAGGYDYDTFAADLKGLVDGLDLRDADLVGFSMGGGEVARYIGRYGTERVAKAVFVSSVPPYLVKADDNPEGVDPGVFAGIKASVAKDRPAFFAGFFQNFFNVDVLKPEGRISDEAVQMSWNVAVGCSALAAYQCVDAWGEDFRADLAKVDVPTLVLQGDADRIVPLAASGERTARMVAGARLEVVSGGPHAVTWTHPDKVNPVLFDFLGR